MLQIRNPFHNKSQSDSEAEQFLRHSMDRYAGMQTFQAEVEWSMRGGGASEDQTPNRRQILYRAPNQFRLTTELTPEMQLNSVSDGKQFVEYSSDPNQEAQPHPAPASIDQVQSMFTSHFMFCGSPIYPFFGGSKVFDRLVDVSKGPVMFADSEMLNQDEGPVVAVTFTAHGMFGQVVASIGANTGLIHGFHYDAEPLRALMNDPKQKKAMRRQMEAKLAEMEPGEEREKLQAYLEDADRESPPMLITETYSNVKVDESIDSKSFSTTLPEGMTVRKRSSDGRSEPPLPAGQPAPDFEVVRLDGRPLKLSDLRGKAVFIDFWATWCGPCRRGLPETERLSKLGPDSNLEVLAITQEPADMVSDFLQEEGLDFPCYIDERGKAQQLYRPPGIPAVVIVDPAGNISDYFIGLQQPSTIEAALRKAGAKI